MQVGFIWQVNFFPLELIYYLQTHNLQIKILCSKTSTTAFQSGIRRWGNFLHQFFFLTCINLYFPFFRCVHFHTLLCLAEFHSNMMLHYAPYSDDLATSQPAGACPWPWGVSQSLLVPLVHLIFKVFFFFLFASFKEK